MKISLNWVKQYADVELSVDELVDKIGAQLGAVEEVIDLGAKYQRIIIAKVVSCEKHPNADKLSVCKIDDGGKAKGVDRDKEGYVQVVCGAPNVRAGLTVAWLPPGSTVPSSYDKDPFVLEARELRGVVSNGMLASASELTISDDHDGILELDEGKAGDDFAKTFKLDDYVIDVENKMFTHRPDCFGILGVAREIAGITGQAFKSPDVYLKNHESRIKNQGKLELKVENGTKLVPRFVGQVFEGVTVGPSPVWLQTYLMRSGIRSINNIVDITNYFMMLTGQPTHAYDYDKLLKVSGLKTASLETRTSKKGDKLRLLNGKEITLEDDSTILITSGDVPVGVGGVMGGADTEVDENTTMIVLECANFDMYSIRRTSMKYGLFTDAVTRFNKGQSALQNDRVVAWASGEIAKVSGGTPGKLVDVSGGLKQPELLRVSVDFVNARLGLDLSRAQMSKLLTNVEFYVELADNKDEMKITPPFWRTDIEIPEDVVEEIGRLYGFDHLPLVLPKRSLSPVAPDALLSFKQTVREILATAGANEVLSYSFVHGNLLEKVGQDPKQAFKLSNAISPDLQYYRLSITPSLLDKVHMNIKAGYDQFALFEINKVHNKKAIGDDKLPREFTNLALVVAADDKLGRKGAAYFEAKNFLDHLANRLGVVLRYEPLTEAPVFGAAAPFDHTRSARIYFGDNILGLVGEYKSDVRRALKLPVHSAGFELTISDALLQPVDSNYQQIPRFPKVEQDISLKVPADVSYSDVYGLLANELLDNADHQAHLSPLDIYQRDDDTEHKQLAFRFTVAHYEKTLKSEEVNAMLDKAAVVAAKELGAKRL